jgi:hypothetical protein
MNNRNICSRSLVFKLNSGVLEECEKWSEIKRNCEMGEHHNGYLYELLESRLNVINFNDIHKIERYEGGFANMDESKQIRYRTDGFHKRKDKYIELYADDFSTEKWTQNELTDILNAYVSIFNHLMKSECISGVIKKYKK